MKRLGYIALAIIYLAAVGLWARHADLPLHSGAAIEAARYHNVLGERDPYEQTAGQLAHTPGRDDD